jgi:hypothetical protein
MLPYESDDYVAGTEDARGLGLCAIGARGLARPHRFRVHALTARCL